VGHTNVNVFMQFPKAKVGLPMAGRIALVFFLAVVCGSTAIAQRWSEEKANAWYAQQPWLVGANYIPSDAINQLEMFQAATFNPALNDKELGLGERCAVLFSPSYGQLESRQLADWILADRLPVRFQLQLHKILWGNEPGR